MGWYERVAMDLRRHESASFHVHKHGLRGLHLLRNFVGVCIGVCILFHPRDKGFKNRPDGPSLWLPASYCRPGCEIRVWCGAKGIGIGKEVKVKHERVML